MPRRGAGDCQRGDCAADVESDGQHLGVSGDGGGHPRRPRPRRHRLLPVEERGSRSRAVARPVTEALRHVRRQALPPENRGGAGPSSSSTPATPSRPRRLSPSTSPRPRRREAGTCGSDRRALRFRTRPRSTSARARPVRTTRSFRDIAVDTGIGPGLHVDFSMPLGTLSRDSRSRHRTCPLRPLGRRSGVKGK